MLTAKRLREVLNFNPETGIFTWRSQKGKCRPGDEAGTSKSGEYIGIRIDKKSYRGHRLAWIYMNDEWPPEGLDHINGLKHDNRWENLRLATYAQNRRNGRKPITNTSGFKGVIFAKRKPHWQARIHIGEKLIYLGGFKTPEEAHEAYIRAAIYHFGSFARAS